MLAVAAGSAGCQTVGPSAFSSLAREEKSTRSGLDYAYSRGRGVQTFAMPPARVQPALVAAFDDLRIDRVRQTSDGGAILLEGTTSDERKASVTLRPHPSGTRLSASIGTFGDPALSRALMDRVGIRLGTLPPAPIPATPPSEPGHNPYFSRSAVPDSEMLRDFAEAPYRPTLVPDNKPN
jgi:hypothetical protein